MMIAHDQEPLDHKRYNKNALETDLSAWFKSNFTGREVYFDNNTDIRNYLVEQNLAALFDGIFIKDRHILLHSELNSSEVSFYQELGFETVYWWSHALIALDWYRFAQHDSRLSFNDSFQLDYNIYNRSWSGSREYRLKLADLLIEYNLTQACNTSFNPIDVVHYRDHTYNRKEFTPLNDLEQLPINVASSDSSAGYNTHDYNQCWIDVVLETVYDDQRWHLTEKILRPIACGKPFILASTPNSLEYLKRYGFKTYNAAWDESYDTIEDPLDRLHAIAELMQWISSRSENKKHQLIQICNNIAKFNHNRFFDKKFFGQVLNEFKNNYNIAYNKTNNTKHAQRWLNFYNQCKSNTITHNLSVEENMYRNRKDIANLLRFARKNRQW